MASNSYLHEIDSDLHILEQKLTEYINVCMDNTVDVAQNIADYCNKNAKLSKDTTDIMRGWITMESDIKHHVKALKHIKSLGSKSSIGLNLSEEFQKKLSELEKNDQSNYKTHAKFKELEEAMNDDGTLEEQLSALKTSLVPSQNDDDIAMMQVEVNIKCPYTGQTMVNPVRNTICKHVYDREGIMDYIKQRKAKAKCPAVGCGNSIPIQPENLEEHTNMKKYISLLKKLNR
ncbi:E3 SUMO-protein ligase NSE2-like [Physella acuta]|uniref:E3 SUMO-protein ligase NSE2-like n=1 Tax=Physella acuta TaxID=109671 RepID=UPI0027DD8D19|nr:E3 SUMO-protein ligase NSE2-like [Physella acuta]XP_059158940.1 E3 SUMO-protein ligase NSE2-like [Physella acuta]